MFSLNKTPIDGCYEINTNVANDPRGFFVKCFNSNEFAMLNLEKNFQEEYYTHSVKNVVRGMHFQIPPHDHAKLVYCISGEVFDVAIDLRINSPTFMKVTELFISSQKKNMAYIPRGVAHGFCVLSVEATLVYNVTSCYSREHDLGVLWSSVPVFWPIKNCIISERDASFPKVQDFVSPFKY